jgi:hypothetical protein
MHRLLLLLLSAVCEKKNSNLEGIGHFLKFDPF